VDLLVWKDKRLLERFLKGKFDGFNWDSLSLSHFLPMEERNSLWVNDGTYPGRARLTSALGYLEQMMILNFSAEFQGVFLEVVQYLEKSWAVSHCHDIFGAFSFGDGDFGILQRC
jgi:hypothetical protein